jgi:hypothetical protein
MGGGLMQLVSFGSLDIHLIGNPQITYFKSIYRRHTNFSIESIEQIWKGNSLYDKASATILRHGDLLYRIYLEQNIKVKIKVNEKDINCGGIYLYNPTHTGIKEIQIIIGNRLIDKQSGKWMEIYSQLTEPNSAGILGIVGSNGGTKFQNMARAGGVIVSSLGKIVDKISSGNTKNIHKLIDTNNLIHNEIVETKFDAYVPLRFWFNKNPGLALPLINLQHQDIVIKLELNNNLLNKHSLVNNGIKMKYYSNRLYADYIFLDTDERRRFANSKHEYLIEQVQHNNFQDKNILDLNFNHPIKELIWTAGQNDISGIFYKLPGSSTNYENHDYYNKTNVSYTLKLNGNERFCPRKLEYFTKQQVYEYHTGTPVGTGDSYNLKYYDYKKTYNLELDETGSFIHKKNYQNLKDINKIINNIILQTGYGQASNNTIAVYSFALKPEEHQPSGTCNFSRINTSKLFINGIDNNYINERNFIEYDVYAINYNILKIHNSISELLYSN